MQTSIIGRMLARDMLHHLITTDTAPAVPPCHFDALMFKDSEKHQSGAPNKNDA